MFLLGKGIPDHIVNLPKIVFSTPGGAMLRPMVEGMQRGEWNAAAAAADNGVETISLTQLLLNRH